MNFSPGLPITVTIDGNEKRIKRTPGELTSQPYSFTDKTKNLRFKIGYSYESRQFMLWVNGVRFEEVPKQAIRSKAHIIRTKIENDWFQKRKK